MSILKVENLSVSHKKNIAIKDVTFEAKKGEIIGFIGADGAGKSSVLNALAGVIKFDGSISYNNKVHKNIDEAQILKSHIGYMPQGIGLVLYDVLTVQEHLDFFANIRDVKIDEEFLKYKQTLLSMSGLENFLDRKAKNLSGGMMQKLSLICTMIHRPSILIFDEPTTGVDPLSRLELWDILQKSTKESGTICIISTAYMAEASKMDKILLFDDGEVIASGTNEELLKSIEAYVYEKTTKIDAKSITISDVTYSLQKLDSKRKKPTLDSLFFINALRKDKLLPKLEISKISSSYDTDKIVMKSEKITKKFGDFIANEDVDIELKQGEILGLLGANGAGKTTFIKMLLGLLPIDSGELFLLDKKIKNQNDRVDLKNKIGYVSQHFALYEDMSVRENMLFFASMHSIETKKAIKLVNKYSKELGFKEYLNEMPRDLPLGINQRFSLAVALLHDPVVLFLDEPTSGVDAIARTQFWELLKALKENRNISILITTHYMSEAEYCDRVVLLKNGKKVEDNSVSNLYTKYPDAKNFEDIFLEYFK